MNHHCINIPLLLLLCSICHFPQTPTAASLPNNTIDANKTLPKVLPQPVPDNNKSSSSGDGKVEVKPVAVQETCELASKKCHSDALHVTACLLPAKDAPEALLVVNDGDGSLKFNFTLPPLEPNPDYIELAAHNFKKINVSASISGATSVIVKADNWTCTIQLKVPLPLPPAVPSSSNSYTAYVTPVNGVYVFLGSSLLVGLILGCYKLRKSRRRLGKEVVPYQQLEMGKNVQFTSSSADVESAGGGGGWDQDWDDDWDEEKAVRTPGGNHVVNGGSRFPDSNGWDDDWKDIS